MLRQKGDWTRLWRGWQKCMRFLQRMPMKNLLKIVTESIDNFARKENTTRLAAIICGEAVILHGIARTTLDLDILVFLGNEKINVSNIVRLFSCFLGQELRNRFEVKVFEVSKDPLDPLRHDLIITESEKRFKKLDVLIANYEWELEGLRSMLSPHAGPLNVYPMPYLAGMKLMAGGAQDEEDVRNLFLIMSDLEKEKA